MLWRKLRLDWRYAIGELTIVVLGVLIALAVDEWNTQRLDHARELEYVASLRLDLEADTAELSRAIEYAERFTASARLVLHALDTGSVSGAPEDFIRAVEYAGFLYFPAYSRYTYDDLLSTGNLRLFEDNEAKRDFAEYYATIDRSEQWMDNWRLIQRRYEQWVAVALELEHREVITAEPGEGKSWLSGVSGDSVVLVATEDDARRALGRISRVPDIDAALRDMVWVQGRHTLFMRNIHGLATELLGRLGEQLDGPTSEANS